MFSNVAHLTLDLSNNKIETLPIDVLYDNETHWEREGTKILKGWFDISWSCNSQQFPGI